MTGDRETLYYQRNGQWVSETFDRTFNTPEAEAWMVVNDVRPPIYSFEGEYWFAYLNPSIGFCGLGAVDDEIPKGIPEEVKLMHLLIG